MINRLDKILPEIEPVEEASQRLRHTHSLSRLKDPDKE